MAEAAEKLPQKQEPKTQTKRRFPRGCRTISRMFARKLKGLSQISTVASGLSR